MLVLIHFTARDVQSQPPPQKKYVNVSHRDGEKTLLPSQGSQFMLMFMGEKKRKNEVKKKRYLYHSHPQADKHTKNPRECQI